MDFGDFVSDTSTDRSEPFIQLLALTDRATAHADFVKTRLNGIDTTGEPQYALLPTSQGQHSPITLRERELFLEAKHELVWVLGPVLGGILLVGILGWCCFRCCCRKDPSGKRKFVAHRRLHDLNPFGDGKTALRTPSPVMTSDGYGSEKPSY